MQENGWYKYWNPLELEWVGMTSLLWQVAYDCDFPLDIVFVNIKYCLPIYQLQGFERHLKIVSQMKDFDKGEKWQDLDVTTWPIVEHFQEQVQTDGYVENLKLFSNNWYIYVCTKSRTIVLAGWYKYKK